MYDSHNFYFVVKSENPCHIEALLFFWVDIGRASNFTIYSYSGPVSWWSKMTGKWLQLFKYEGLPHFSLHISENGKPRPIETLVSFPGWILVQVCYYPFLITPIQCIGDNRIVGEWLGGGGWWRGSAPMTSEEMVRGGETWAYSWWRDKNSRR